MTKQANPQYIGQMIAEDGGVIAGRCTAVFSLGKAQMYVVKNEHGKFYIPANMAITPAAH